MNMQTLAATAAVMLFAAQVAHAAPSETQIYTDQAQARAHRLLAATGIDFNATSISVRAMVDPDGRLNRIEVLRSSGSPATDRAVETVLKRLVVADPPVGLADGAVTLNVGHAPIVQTAAR